MRLIDLTHPFGPRMPAYPGDPISRLEQVASFEKDGCVVHEVTCSMHVGTHMDAPRHMLPGGSLLSEQPLERFIGPGVLIDARGRRSVSADLLARTPLQTGDVVLVRTGWSDRFQSPAYYTDYPPVDEPFARALVDAGIRILGLDTPSPDYAPFPIHRLLLSHGILILENLTALDQLADASAFEVIALPCRFEAEAAPARVIARILP